MKNFIRKWWAVIIAVAIVTSIAACEKSDFDKPQTTELTKKGGNGNGGNGGGNGGGGTTTNPCQNYPVYPVINTTPTDWNITADTSRCGHITIRWNQQPGFSANVDSCDVMGGKYYIIFTKVIPDPTAYPCGGSSVTTNAYYYTYGTGCSMLPGRTQYYVDIMWFQRDTVAKTTYQRYAQRTVITTGTNYLWNCTQ